MFSGCSSAMTYIRDKVDEYILQLGIKMSVHLTHAMHSLVAYMVAVADPATTMFIIPVVCHHYLEDAFKE